MRAIRDELPAMSWDDEPTQEIDLKDLVYGAPNRDGVDAFVCEIESIRDEISKIQGSDHGPLRSVYDRLSDAIATFRVSQ